MFYDQQVVYYNALLLSPEIICCDEGKENNIKTKISKISGLDIQYETCVELINKWYFTNFKIYLITLFQHFRKNKNGLFPHYIKSLKYFIIKKACLISL